MSFEVRFGMGDGGDNSKIMVGGVQPQGRKECLDVSKLIQYLKLKKLI